MGQPGGQSWCCTGLGREWVQCRVCGCLIVPSKHQHGPDGWGDTCSAGAPSAGHGRVETGETLLRNSSGCQELPFMLLRAVFPHGRRWHVEHPLQPSPCALCRPAGDTRSPRRDAVTETARPHLAEKKTPPASRSGLIYTPETLPSSEEPALIDGSLTGPSPHHLHPPPAAGDSPICPSEPSPHLRGAGGMFTSTLRSPWLPLSHGIAVGLCPNPSPAQGEHHQAHRCCHWWVPALSSLSRGLSTSPSFICSHTIPPCKMPSPIPSS